MAERYEFSRIQNQIDKLEDSIVLQIGVLGEFNSGKSSLINMMLGKKILPVMDKPTTGSITELEPLNLVDTINFFRRMEDGRQQISALEFSDIALGKKEGIAVLQVPASDILQEGYRIVDTPGLASLNQTHTDITFGYLPYLDGIIICHDVNKGGLTQSVIRFLNRTEVKVLIDNFLFVLTHADQKTEESVEKIRCEIVQTLREEFELQSINLEERVIPISSLKALEQPLACAIEIAKFKESFNKCFVNKKQNLLNDRTEKELFSIGQELLSLLQDKYINTKLDNSELKEKEDALQIELQSVKKKKIREEEKLHSLKQDIQKTLDYITSQYVNLYENATEEELPSISHQMVADITSTLNQKIGKYIDDFTMPSLRYVGSEIEGMIAKVNKIKNISSTITTAAVMAAISGGSGLLANAAEAGVGGAAQIAGRTAAKQVVQSTVTEAAKQSLFKQAFLFVGNVVDKINPINYVADYVAQKAKKRYATELLEKMAYRVSDEVYDYIKSYFESEIFTPLEESYEDRQTALRNLWKEQKQTTEKQGDLRQKLEEDIFLIKDCLNK